MDKRSWKEIYRENLDRDDLETIRSIKVVERVSKGGNGSTAGKTFLCMCFFLKSTETKSVYLSKMSNLEEGDEVDPKSVELIAIKKNGKITIIADGNVK